MHIAHGVRQSVCNEVCVKARAYAACMKANVSKVCVRIRQRRVQVEALQGLLSQVQTAGGSPPGRPRLHFEAAAGSAPGGPTRPTQAQADEAAETAKPGLDVVLSEFTLLPHHLIPMP